MILLLIFEISEEKFSSLLDSLFDSILDDFAEMLVADISQFIIECKKVDIDDFAIYATLNYGSEFGRLICELKHGVTRKNK